jgi:protein-tyrosine phosphatase
METPRILFVCLGNICRSPMAEGAFRHLAREKGIDIELDSAGTGDWHVGEAPDHRMQATAKSHGVDISDLRARHFTVEDFDAFDRIYVMDESNYDNVVKLARNEEDSAKVKMMLNEIYPGENMPVPDPYFGGQQGFEHVYDLLTRSAEKVLNEL